MEKEKEVPTVNIEFPIKKIILVGIGMIIFIALIDFLSNYFGSNLLFQNKYVLYSVIALLAVGFIFFLFRIFIKRKNFFNPSENENGEGDTKRVLKIIDKLLEKLPEDELEKFSKTKDAGLYRAVLKKYGIK
ncbi:Uncharacterised protein [uncultured archaeon]|nr:Uncharacterised protein [uncultured archaeon]